MIAVSDLCPCFCSFNVPGKGDIAKGTNSFAVTNLHHPFLIKLLYLYKLPYSKIPICGYICSSWKIPADHWRKVYVLAKLKEWKGEYRYNAKKSL